MIWGDNGAFSLTSETGVSGKSGFLLGGETVIVFSMTDKMCWLLEITDAWETSPSRGGAKYLNEVCTSLRLLLEAYF